MQALNRFHDTRPLRMLAATLVVAVAATLSQTAMARPHGPMEGPGGHGMMGMAPHQMERALEKVGATPEQRAQIQQIFQSAHTDLKAQREAGRGLRAQSQALFTQPTVDARAAESLRQQMLAQHDASSKRMLQAMLDASRVLTAEQRKSLGEMQAQRRALAERHRSERESLAPATR